MTKRIRISRMRKLEKIDLGYLIIMVRKIRKDDIEITLRISPKAGRYIEKV